MKSVLVLIFSVFATLGVAAQSLEYDDLRLGIAVDEFAETVRQRGGRDMGALEEEADDEMAFHSFIATFEGLPACLVLTGADARGRIATYTVSLMYQPWEEVELVYLNLKTSLQNAFADPVYVSDPTLVDGGDNARAVRRHLSDPDHDISEIYRAEGDAVFQLMLSHDEDGYQLALNKFVLSDEDIADAPATDWGFVNMDLYEITSATPLDSFIETLTANGCTEVERTDESVVFSGSYADQDECAVVVLPNGRLAASVFIQLPYMDSWDDLQDTYSRLKAFFTDRYGAPVSTDERLPDLGRRASQNQKRRALQQGEAAWECAFQTDNQVIALSIDVEDNPARDTSVYVVYGRYAR